MIDETLPRGWRITWRGRSWTHDDLLASDVATVAALAGGGWASCDPWAGPAELMAMIATLEARESERDVREVLNEVKATKAFDLLSAIRGA